MLLQWENFLHFQTVDTLNTNTKQYIQAILKETASWRNIKGKKREATATPNEKM